MMVVNHGLGICRWTYLAEPAACWLVSFPGLWVYPFVICFFVCFIYKVGSSPGHRLRGSTPARCAVQRSSMKCVFSNLFVRRWVPLWFVILVSVVLIKCGPHAACMAALIIKRTRGIPREESVEDVGCAVQHLSLPWCER